MIDEYESEVFVSYAWSGESERMVDELEQAFAARGIKIKRDKKDLGYKDSIEEFEQRIANGQCIVLVISDKYLRSEHCMYELVEADKNQNLRNRIFPIVLAEAKIYDAVDRVNYIKHWEAKTEKLNQAIKGINIMTHLSGITADLDKYANIRASIDHLTDLLSDMNTLDPETHAATGFSTLIEAVEKAMRKKKVSSAPLGVNVAPPQTAVKEFETSKSTAKSLTDHYQRIQAKLEYLAEFQRKINQSVSNLGILITAQGEIDDLAKAVHEITEEVRGMDRKTAFPLPDLNRASDLLGTIHHLIKSAAGSVATGGNPTQSLQQISQHLPLLRNIIKQLALWLEKTGVS